MKIYFAGQSNFGNRGCEALVRSTTALIRKRYPNTIFLTPSVYPALDNYQWVHAMDNNVKFVSSEPFPASIRWWARMCKLLPMLEKLWVPKVSLSKETANVISEVDAVLMIGGDNISLDYGVASLYAWKNVIERSVEANTPVFLWAGSVGPFSSKPHVEKEMIRHLKYYSGITVRETATLEYLRGLGIENVTLVADPAFTLEVEKFNVSEFVFENSENILGFNISPLVRGYRKTVEEREQLDRDSISFIKHVIDNKRMSVLLIPHVDPLDGESVNSDSAYMRKILNTLGEAYKEKIKLLPPTLNASQLKYLISRCRFFIGARTHATIAAFSTEIPTISIAYSVKAKGINQDIFGHTQYVLETPTVSTSSLMVALELLIKDELEIKEILKKRIPELRQLAFLSVEMLNKLGSK